MIRRCKEIAVKNAQALASGHTFVLVLSGAYPINVLNAIRNVHEVCSMMMPQAISGRNGFRIIKHAIANRTANPIWIDASIARLM
jgi:adenosine/AMP kinase